MAELSPIGRFTELDAWSASLARIASAPLEFRPDFPDVARRFEAWWNHEPLDKPIFICMGAPERRRRLTKRLDLLHDPDAWLAEKFARQPDDPRGWLSLFLFSNFYLLLLFLVMVGERLIRHTLS
jgi:hypothetical protein